MAHSSALSDPDALAAAQARIQALEATVATLQQRVRDQRRFLDQFSRHAPAAIAMFDRELNYLMVSDRWLEDYRLRGQDLIGRNHYEVFPDIPDRWKAVHQRCLQGVTESCEADPFPRADGYTEYINWVVAPWYKEGDKVGGLIFFTEVVTEQVEAQQDLQRLHAQVKASHRRLGAYAEAVTRAVGEVLHSGLEAVAQWQVPPLAADDPRAVDEQVGYLRAGLRRGQRLIESLQAFAHGGSYGDKPQGVDLNQVLAAVLDTLAPLVEARQAHIRSGPLPTVTANEFEMMALFQNLIGNALRYHGPGQPEIRVSVQEKDGYWTFSVQDNGPGIPPEIAEEIFQLFRRTDLDPSHQGIGISLPVCKRIVEAQGGEIWLQSLRGAGTQVFFTLPL